MLPSQLLIWQVVSSVSAMMERHAIPPRRAPKHAICRKNCAALLTTLAWR